MLFAVIGSVCLGLSFGTVVHAIGLYFFQKDKKLGVMALAVAFMGVFVSLCAYALSWIFPS